MKIKISDLAKESGVKFGTSGARGLVSKITDLVSYAYTKSFIQFMEDVGDLKKNNEEIALGGDLRDSTDRIMNAVAKAIMDCGYKVRYCGKVPTPTLIFYNLENKMASIMVTGSHIPADRNGIKYNKIEGEVLKEDEEKMVNQEVVVDENFFDQNGFLKSQKMDFENRENEAIELFKNRYINFFDKDILKGKKILVYEHSAVGRDMLCEVVKFFGAEVIRVGRSEKDFIPLDTEAIDENKLFLFKKWAKEYKPDAIVSTDGDSDRPLVCDENGDFIRGDILGILVSKFIDAEAVVTPVSANSAVLKTGLFKQVSRTKIGSPYVIAEMMKLAKVFERIVGYESNGGFLLYSKIKMGEKKLDPLPTRDSFLPILSILVLSVLSGHSLSSLVSALPKRFTYSERLENVPVDKSLSFMKSNFETGDFLKDKANADTFFGNISGAVIVFERIDGIRMLFVNGEVIHIRPSGNAPELRVYTEADTKARAEEICSKSLSVIKENLSI